MPHRNQQPSQAEIRLQQAFPTSSAIMPAVNPRPMEQLAKTVVVVPASSKQLKHSGSSSLLKQRSNESIGFFAKLASRRSSTASSGSDGSPAAHGPLYTPLEWSCKGSMEDELEESTSQRPPSLTHSRASSSDSAVSSTPSISGDKPLPALPLNFGSDWKGRPFSVAVLEDIAELGSPTPSRRPSAEDQSGFLQIHLPHLDLAIPPSTNTYSPSLTSSLTPKRPQSSFSYLPGTPVESWSPRLSLGFSPSMSDEDVFGLEATLAQQELLDTVEANQISLTGLFPTQRTSTVVISGSLPSPALLQDESFSSLWYFEQASNAPKQQETVPAAAEALLEDVSPDVEDSVQVDNGAEAPIDEEAFVVPDEESESDSTAETAIQAHPLRSSRRQSIIKSHRAGKLSLGGGWRGWRTGSQPNTPCDEVPPVLQVQGSLLTPTRDFPISPKTTSEMDYFGSAMVDKLASISEASAANSLFEQLAGDPAVPTLTVDESSSMLPKLSPDFSFGRRTPTPTPGSSGSANSDLPESSEGSSINRRPRAASADEVNLASIANASSTANVTLPTARAQGQRKLHRMRMSNVRHSTTGPRMPTQSFDAQALAKLKSSAGSGTKYEWI